MRLRTVAIALAAACIGTLPLGGCTTTGRVSDQEMLARMLSGQSVMQGAQLDAALKAASAYPLGSRENPVRAAMPAGQRAYLARLRCPDGKTPTYSRAGNLGPGVYGNIVDAYQVECATQDMVTVVMDMYHQGYVEQRAVPGFTIVAP